MTGIEQIVDVVVVGLGPGGEEVASRLADAGLTVLGVERELVGGECPYWGCVPSKMIVRAAETLAEARRVHQLAGAAQVYPDYAPVARRIRSEATDNWDDTVAVRRFEKHGGRFVRGQATLVGPHGSGSAKRCTRHRWGWCWPRVPRRSAHRSPGSPAPASGPIGRRSRPRSRPARWSCSVVALSGWSWPRRSPGSGR